VAVDADGGDAGVATKTGDRKRRRTVVSRDEKESGVVGGVAAGVCDVDGEGAEGALVDVIGCAGVAAGGDELGDGEGDVGGDCRAGDGDGGFECGVVLAWVEVSLLIIRRDVEAVYHIRMGTQSWGTIGRCDLGWRWCYLSRWKA